MTKTQAQLSDLPDDTLAVVTRWNPEGAAELEAGRGPRLGVFVAGPPRAGKSTLVRGLRAVDSAAVDFVEDPVDAGVVLMVLDAAAPLGREELAVLDVAAPPERPVIFALTKTDVHRDWVAVNERNRMLLARHSARFAEAEIHPVAASGSGVESLLAAILLTAGNEAGGARSAIESVLEQTRRMIVSTARSIRQAEPGAELRAERVQVLAHRDALRTERLAQLRSQVQLARVELMHEVAAQVRTSGATTRAEIDRADRATLARYPDRMAQLIRERGAVVDAAVTTRLDDLHTRMGVTPTALGSEFGLTDALSQEGPQQRHRGLEDRITILIGASVGLGLGGLLLSPLSMVPALDIATIPLTLALGALAAWWLTRARGHIAERAHVRQWATEALAHVRSHWEQFVLGRLLAAEAQIGEAVIADSRERALRVDERVAEIDAELRSLAVRFKGQLSSCERDLAAVDRGLRSVRKRAGELDLVDNA
ncbi:hypothetical protein [Rhodococcus sp. WMMA185]|uniref:hypothetical protein n=1 Tax=Rhodococcus sp. WMMA185 TaxID=679318 RepID=UPI0008782A2B|nr:hypothetical protein [Rhodococcus sp. WMMA185]